LLASLHEAGIFFSIASWPVTIDASRCWLSTFPERGTDMQTWFGVPAIGDEVKLRIGIEAYPE